MTRFRFGVGHGVEHVRLDARMRCASLKHQGRGVIVCTSPTDMGIRNDVCPFPTDLSITYSTRINNSPETNQNANVETKQSTATPRAPPHLQILKHSASPSATPSPPISVAAHHRSWLPLPPARQESSTCQTAAGGLDVVPAVFCSRSRKAVCGLVQCAPKLTNAFCLRHLLRCCASLRLQNLRGQCSRDTKVTATAAALLSMYIYRF
ncbi:hypothetical protein HDK64DRAFT_12535 [Phyllosticta capitalensis]